MADSGELGISPAFQEDHIDAAKRLLGEPDDGVVVVLACHVELPVDGMAPLGLDLGGDLLDLVVASRS
jgi:hypothetical protein